MTPELYEYMVEHGSGQDKVLRRVERETASLGSIAVMQIAPEQGALLTLLARSIGARRAVEVGTFTGYSAICIARGLPEDGRLLCCELSEEWARQAQRNLEPAGLDRRVEIRVAPGLDTLRCLPDGEQFDFAFVDADKPAYPDYYEEILSRLRPGGMVLLDNMLLGGRVLDPAADDGSAQAIARLNAQIAADDRVDSAMIGVADGLTVARKR
ncbi:MAG: O-methyltransferase [Actinomycetota bacterium]|nr:O-methyltransferase [Actinomycetota bacterium]